MTTHITFFDKIFVLQSNEVYGGRIKSFKLQLVKKTGVAAEVRSAGKCDREPGRRGCLSEARYPDRKIAQQVSHT